MDAHASASVPFVDPVTFWLRCMLGAQELHRELGRAVIEMHSNLVGKYAYEVFPQYFRNAAPARPFESLREGDRAELTTEITHEKLLYFARASGDWQELHFDRKFAAETRYGEPIAHGLLVGSFVSALLATELPGRGTIYVSQSFFFKAPVFIGDKVTVSAEIEKIEPGRMVTLRIEVKNQKGEMVLDGQTVAKAPK